MYWGTWCLILGMCNSIHKNVLFLSRLGLMMQYITTPLSVWAVFEAIIYLENNQRKD